ncbi:MAG: Trk system potassium transporter TrkA [bacterium]
MKKIAIVGAGEMGGFIAERLTEEQFEVTVIERNGDVLAELQNETDVAGVQGDATNIKDLMRADIQDADLFVATTRQDETNLIACLLSRKLKIPHNIALTRYLGSRGNPLHLANKALGIDLIVNTSEAVRNEIMEVIETTGASEVATFSEGRIILIGYPATAGSPLVGKTVATLAGAEEEPIFHLASMVRKHKMMQPLPDTVVEKDDFLYLITTQANLPRFNAALKVETIKTRTAVINGDNFLSQMLADSLLSRHFQVTMIARSEKKAQLLRDHFQHRRHLHLEMGEGTEARLLRRVKVPTTSVFISTTNDDAANLTACMLAKELGVGKTVATIKREDILPLCHEAGVDANIAPRLATVKVIQKVVHENKMLDYRAVAQTKLEVVEVAAQGDCQATKTTLGKLKLPEGVVIGGVVSNGVPFLPKPNYKVCSGDKVIVLTSPEHLLEVENLFSD